MKFIILLSIFITVGSISRSQDAVPPKILPPSPTSYELGRYGDIPLNLSVGAMNLSVGLMQYGTKNLQLPISLSYYSNGFRVNEISSRAGFDWVFNAGGVITRTIYDEADITSAKLAPPNFASQDDDLYNYLEAAVAGGMDTQPDIFRYNFPGYTGKFIIDDEGVPRSIPQNNLKIEYISTGSLSFVVTTPEGVKYFFGGTNATESSKISSSSSCGGAGHQAGTDDFVPNSWYLTKIQHPLGDIIEMSYEIDVITYRNGVSQTLAYNYPGNLYGNTIGAPPCQECEVEQDRTCYTVIESNIVRVKEITSSAYGKIVVTYKAGVETNDKLIDYLILYDKDNIRLKKILLTHQTVTSNLFWNANVLQEETQRSFLSQVDEFGVDDYNAKTSKFFYKNLDELPVRMSFAQDYHGFFNGKTNSFLVPLPESLIDRSHFGGRGGNRAPDQNFSSKGMLAKVVYPTSGSSQMEYEGNDSYQTEQIEPAAQEIAVSAAGSDDSYFNLNDYVSNSRSIIVNLSQPIVLNASFGHYSGLVDGDSHIKMIVQIIDSATNNVLFYEHIYQNENRNFNLGISLGTTVILKIEVFGYDGYNGFAHFYYLPPSQTITHNKQYPGVRISRLINKAQEDGISEIKRYNYRYLNEPYKSSGRLTGPNEIYTDSRTFKFFCSPTNYPEIEHEFACFYKSLYSNSVTASNSTSATPIIYESVLVSEGENYENGGSEFIYSYSQDGGGVTVMGSSIVGAPYDNLGYDSGQPLSENIFKIVNGNIIYLKKVQNFYKTDNRLYDKVTGYVIRKKWTVGASIPRNSPPQSKFFEPFDVTSYVLHCYWNYLEKTSISNFDTNGANPVMTTTNFYYDNTDHLLLSRQEHISSDGINNIISYKYPQDIILTGATEIARQQLIANHQINTVLKTSQAKNSAVFSIFYDYFLDPNVNYVLPKAVRTINSSDNIEHVQLKYLRYDDLGNLLSISKDNGPVTSYIWSYKGQFPVAEIKNIDYPNLELILGATNISNFRSTTPDKTSVDNFLSNIHIQSPETLLTTVVHMPQIGIVSQSDTRGISTYYEYDSFQRLKNIKDQYGNIVTSYCYNYAGQLTDCSGYAGELEIPSGLVETETGYSADSNDLCMMGEEGVPPHQFLPIFGLVPLGAAVSIGQPTPVYYTDSAGTTLAPNGYYTRYDYDPFYGYFIYRLQNGLVIASFWCYEF
jgi:hypothetical protein